MRVRRTSFGIPHIEAKDMGGLGFGEGYAQAEDHLCTIEDQVVKVRGERSRYFGAGRNDEHIVNDTAMRALRITGQAAVELSRMGGDLRKWHTGFAAGFNHYLATADKSAISDWCRGAEWVRPITPVDVVAIRRGYVMTLPQFSRAIADAAVPGSASPSAAAFDWPAEVNASNAWAIGRDLSSNKTGIMVANPHYPWVGANRFWEKHLTVPGKLNVYGVGLIGSPGVVIGFNQHVGWTHTVSPGARLVFYSLELVPGEPTSYKYDGKRRRMRARNVKVEVRQPDGSIKTIERVVWFSHYGPILSIAPIFRWSTTRALTVRDANSDNEHAAEQWLAMSQARSLRDLKWAHEKYQSLPWVTTVATGREGFAWFIDSASTPNLSSIALQAWLAYRREDPWSAELWKTRSAILLNGSDSTFEWKSAKGSRVQGLVPFREMPQITRTDYVFNANDSYNLANSKVRMDRPYSPLHGSWRTPSLRTQLNDLVLSNQSSDRPAGDDGRFNADECAQAILNNRSLLAERVRPKLVERCLADRSGELQDACEVLIRWDGQYNLSSKGAVLFREWALSFDAMDHIFRNSFNDRDPIGTPNGLASGEAITNNLKRAAALLRSKNLSLDVALGDLQHANKPGPRIPIHGGHPIEGVLNLVNTGANTTTLEPGRVVTPLKGSRWLSDEGYLVTHGSSFVAVVEFTKDGPQARAILSYSQSGDPRSAHFRDQTEMFSRKQWRPVLFRVADIESDVKSDLMLRIRR